MKAKRTKKEEIFEKVKNNINKKKFSEILKFSRFHFLLFIKKPLFIIISILYLLSQPLLILIIELVTKDLLDYSFIMNISVFGILNVWFIYIVMVLFLDTKFNGIDHIIFSKNLSKTKLFFIRFSIIFLLNSIILFSQTFLSWIIIPSLGLDLNWIGFVTINNLLINLFLSIFIFSILTIGAIFFNQIFFSLFSILILFLNSILPIFTRSIEINKSKELIVYNSQNYNSFSKINIINDKENTELIANEINLNSQNNVDKNIVETLNNPNIYNYFILGELTSSFSSSLLNNLNIQNQNVIETNFSLLKNSYDEIQIQNVVPNFQEIISFRPNDISPFSLNTLQYENLLIEQIKQLMNEDNILNLKDVNVVSLLLNEISKNSNWNDPSLISYIDTLNLLLGINVKYSQLFYLFNNYDLLSQKTPNLLNRIEKEFSKELKDLFSFLWTNNITKLNVNELKAFGDIDLIYPNNRIINNTKPPLKNDLVFIKDSLIIFNGNTISYLNQNNQYETVSGNLVVNGTNISDKNTWDKYVEQNTITLESAKMLLANLNESLNNLFSLEFAPNSFDLFKYSYFLKENKTSYLDNEGPLIAGLSIITIILFSWTIINFKNKNYKK